MRMKIKTYIYHLHKFLGISSFFILPMILAILFVFLTNHVILTIMYLGMIYGLSIGLLLRNYIVKKHLKKLKYNDIRGLVFVMICNTLIIFSFISTINDYSVLIFVLIGFMGMLFA